MAAPYIDVLRREFAGEDGSFLIQLRCNMNWDKESFSRLVDAMEACCKACERQQSLERWTAEGFWYLSWFVKQWTEHPNFPRPQPARYYEDALTRLDDLAFWFFMGCNPREERFARNEE